MFSMIAYSTTLFIKCRLAFPFAHYFSKTPALTSKTNRMLCRAVLIFVAVFALHFAFVLPAKHKVRMERTKRSPGRTKNDTMVLTYAQPSSGECSPTVPPACSCRQPAVLW